MPHWTKGIDYKVLKGGKVSCLYCERELDKTELGPHLSTCPERKPLFQIKDSTSYPNNIQIQSKMK
jgi:hypothetical protein